MEDKDFRQESKEIEKELKKNIKTLNDVTKTLNAVKQNYQHGKKELNTAIKNQQELGIITNLKYRLITVEININDFKKYEKELVFNIDILNFRVDGQEIKLRELEIYKNMYEMDKNTTIKKGLKKGDKKYEESKK